MSSAKTYALYAYGGVVALSFAIGAIESIGPYFRWRRDRKYRRIRFKSVETIVNIGVDVGKFIFDTTSAGFCSAVIGGTAPVSVPLMLMFREEEQSQEQSQEQTKEKKKDNVDQ